MDQPLKATEITIGIHPDGYRIDRTASAMDRYTKWDILPSNRWCNPEPVCFDALPEKGWFAKDRFDWDKINMTGERDIRLC